MEGPQAAVALVSALMGAWLFVPWLDRMAHKNADSPRFTDTGVAALLFFGFLTLKAWDIGSRGDPLSPGAADRIAATCAGILVAVAAVVATLRRFYFRQQWFLWSAAVVLHAVLHGFAGLSYLLSGAIAFVVAVAAFIVLNRCERRGTPGGAR